MRLKNYKKQLESYTNWSPDMIKVIGGGLAGSAAISITYPTDLIRRRLQLQGFDKSVPGYAGIMDCIRKVVKKEGVTGLYRGLPASYIKFFKKLFSWGWGGSFWL